MLWRILRSTSFSFLSFLAACSSAGSGAPPGAPASDDAADAAPSVPSDCELPSPCAVDSDCGAGARCDTALSPPACVKLYCLPADAACSDRVQCQNGFLCAKSKCRACDTCGDACVDLQSDETNCGACGRHVTTGHICLDGESACNDLDPTTAPPVTVEDVKDCKEPAADTATSEPPPGTYVLSRFCENPELGALPVPIGASVQWVSRVSGHAPNDALDTAFTEGGVVRRMTGKGDLTEGAVTSTCVDAADATDPLVQHWKDGGPYRFLTDGRLVFVLEGGTAFAIFTPR